MPIKPENKSRYPKNWKEIRERILIRANNRCEFCGVENHTYRYNPYHCKTIENIILQMEAVKNQIGDSATKQ